MSAGAGETCRRWRAELAARALGEADPATDLALDAHLEGCADCRAELEELRSTVAAVSLTDPEHLRAAAAAPALADRIITRVAQEAAASRRRRTGRVVGAAAAVVVAAVVVGVALVAGSDGDDGGGRRIELVGPGAVDGEAELTARPWGTEVHLEVEGLDDGEVYWLWLTDEAGDRVGAGTFAGTGAPASATLAAALPLEETRRIWVTDEDDRVVLDARITPD